MRVELLSSTINNLPICVHDIAMSSTDIIWDWHFHDEYEMYLALEGKRIFYVGEEEYIVDSGDIIFVNEKVPHKTKNIKDSSGFIIQFSPLTKSSDTYKHLMQFIKATAPDASLFNADSKINNELTLCLKNILNENTVKQKSYEEFIIAELYKIFAILYRYEIIKNIDVLFSMKEVEKILPAIAYIDKHYKEKITLQQVSDLTNFDKSHFCRVFKKSTNQSLVDYINFVRISKAERLLLSSRKTISEISEETGFLSVAYFTKIFKKLKNCTPSQYKKIKT